MEGATASPRVVRRVAGVLTVANGLVAVVAVPAGLYYGVRGLVGPYYLVGMTPDVAARQVEGQRVFGAVVVPAVFVGLALLWGYVRVWRGRTLPLSARAFWSASVVWNGVLVAAALVAVTASSTGPFRLRDAGQVLVMVAWPLAVGLLSLKAYHRTRPDLP